MRVSFDELSPVAESSERGGRLSCDCDCASALALIIRKAANVQIANRDIGVFYSHRSSGYPSLESIPFLNTSVFNELLNQPAKIELTDLFSGHLQADLH